ncbi:uncharacterized protein LOC115211873 [Octopus sinensis]|uniref:Uncharacterized protein LOC115211873 n=1 Tax=Octopus sinensis TaxID=2607531 RepID=A0A6P7SDR4_9MOLL|nr:uncharacterized protein LOC115211873 [Octopus sinensis]XP_036358971.1 uncharacterized protein LOC115211873 [Octopus sinensis]
METATSEASGKSEGKPWTNILVESSALDQLKVPLQGSSRLKYTCISVSRRYVALGSNTGGVYVFGRQNFNNLRVVFADMKADTINLVSLSPFDNNVGFANSMGQVFVMETNIEKRTKPEKLRMSNIHVGRIVTAVAWNTTGSQFFIGDNMGTVSIIYVSNSKAKDLFGQPLDVILNLDSAIVQMDWAREKLLVSTLTRCYLCLTDKAKYFQIGKKLRDGKFGTCFYHNTSLSTPLIYSARPGSRMWEVDFEGQVLNTHQFKQLLAIPPLPILDLRCKEYNLPKDEKWNVLSVNFVQIKQVKNMLLAWTDSAIFIFDPVNVRTVLWCADLKEINDIAVIENEMYIFYRGSEIKKLSLMTVTNCISWLQGKQRHKLSEDLRLEFMISLSSSPQSLNETGVSNYQELGKSVAGSFLQNKIIPKDMAVTTRLSALPSYLNRPKEKVDENSEFPKEKSEAKTNLDSCISTSAPFQKDSNCLQSDRLSLFLNQNGVQPYIENHKSPSEFFENSMQQILIENEECDKNSILTSPENCEEPLENLYDQEILHTHDSGSLYRNLLSEVTSSSGRSTPRPVAIPRPRPLNPSSINNVLLSPSVYAMLNYTNITKYESLDQVGETEEGSPTVDAILPKGDENKSVRKVFKKKKPTIVQLDAPSSKSKADRSKKWKVSKLLSSGSTAEDKADKGEKLERPVIVESSSRDCLSDSSEMTQSADNSAMESSVVSSDSKVSGSSSKEETPHSTVLSQISNRSERLNSKANTVAYNAVPDSLSTAKTSSDEGTPLKSVSDSNSNSSSSGVLMTNRLERIAATVGEVKHEMKQYNNNSMSEPGIAPLESSTGMFDDTELSLTSAKMNLMSIKDSLSSRTKSFIKSISRSSILSRGDQLVNVLKKKLPEIGDGKEIIDFQIAEEMINPETNVDTGEEVAWHMPVIESKSYADTTSLVAATDEAHEELDCVEVLLHPDHVEDVIKKWVEYLHLTQNAVLHKLIDLEKHSEKDTVSTSSSDNLLNETSLQHMPDPQKHPTDNGTCKAKVSAKTDDKNCEVCSTKNHINEAQQPVEKMTSSSQKVVSENEAHNVIVDSGVELFNPEAQVHSSLEQESIEDKTEGQTLDMDRSIYTRGVTSSFISTSDSSFVDPEETAGTVGVGFSQKNSRHEHGFVGESINSTGEPVESSNSCVNEDHDDDYQEKEKIEEEEEEKKDSDKTSTSLIADSDRSSNDKLNNIVKEVTKKDDDEKLNDSKEIESLSSKNMGKEHISPVKTLNENCKNFHINEGFEMSGSPNFFSPGSVKKSDFGEPDFVEKVSNPTLSEFSTLKDAFGSDHNIISSESVLDQTDSNICETDRSQDTAEIGYNSLFSSGESKEDDRIQFAEDQGSETGSKSAMDSSHTGSDNGSHDKKEECLFEPNTHASVFETVNNVEDNHSDIMNKNNNVLGKMDGESKDNQNEFDKNSCESKENDPHQKCSCSPKEQDDDEEEQQHDELCDPKLFMKCFVSDPFGLSLEQHKLASMLAVACFQTKCTGDICSKVFQSSCFFRCVNTATSPCASQKLELSDANSSSKSIDTSLLSESETQSFSSSSSYVNSYSKPKHILFTYQTSQFASGSCSPKDCHGRFCHLFSRFVETQLLEGTRSKLSPHPPDHVLSVEEHYDWQMSLFIRCYFHLLSLDVVRRHVYSYHGYCFRSWLALVHCLQEIGKDDIIGKCLQKKKLQQAVDLLHSEDIHFSAMVCIVGHLSRLFSFRPAEIVEFSVQNSEHVQPLDVLYLSYLHNFPLHHFHSYMMARINVSFDKKLMLAKLSENNETKFTWLEYLLSKVDDKLFTKAIPLLPSAGMHLLKWKYRDIIVFLCNNCRDESVADEHWKKVLHLCLINKFWLGCLMCLKKLKLWHSLITIMVALGDLSLFDADNTYGYVPESEEEWLYLLDQKKMQSAEDDTNAFQSSLIGAVMKCYKDCGVFSLEEYKSLEESLHSTEQDSENLSETHKELTSQIFVPSPLTLDSVYRLFIQRMGPQRGIHLLLEHNCLKPSDYPLSFYQSCLFGSLIQRQQRFIIHNMLEKIDEYFWSKKPASMAPAIYFAVEEEKNTNYLEPSVSTQELLKQLQPLNGQRFAEEKEYHWGSSIDIFTACPCCHVTLSAVISHMESGIVIFECGHAYHRFCVGPKKMCVLCPSIM